MKLSNSIVSLWLQGDPIRGRRSRLLSRDGRTWSIALHVGLECVVLRTRERAAHGFLQGQLEGEIEKRDAQLARHASRLLPAARKLRDRWKGLPKEDRDPFEWRYINGLEKIRTDTLDANLESRHRPLYEKPDKSKRSLERDLKLIVDICEAMEQKKGMKGKKVPNYAMFSAIDELRLYWKNKLGRTSGADRFIAFTIESVELFAETKSVRSVIEVMRRRSDIEF